MAAAQMDRDFEDLPCSLHQLDTGVSSAASSSESDAFVLSGGLLFFVFRTCVPAVDVVTTVEVVVVSSCSCSTDVPIAFSSSFGGACVDVVVALVVVSAGFGFGFGFATGVGWSVVPCSQSR